MDGDGELRLTIIATLAQEESRKISERVRAGQKISRATERMENLIAMRANGEISKEQFQTLRQKAETELPALYVEIGRLIPHLMMKRMLLIWRQPKLPSIPYSTFPIRRSTAA